MIDVAEEKSFKVDVIQVVTKAKYVIIDISPLPLSGVGRKDFHNRGCDSLFRDYVLSSTIRFCKSTTFRKTS